MDIIDVVQEILRHVDRVSFANFLLTSRRYYYSIILRDLYARRFPYYKCQYCERNRTLKFIIHSFGSGFICQKCIHGMEKYLADFASGKSWRWDAFKIDVVLNSAYPSEEKILIHHQIDQFIEEYCNDSIQHENCLNCDKYWMELGSFDFDAFMCMGCLNEMKNDDSYSCSLVDFEPEIDIEPYNDAEMAHHRGVY